MPGRRDVAPLWPDTGHSDGARRGSWWGTNKKSAEGCPALRGGRGLRLADQRVDPLAVLAAR